MNKPTTHLLHAAILFAPTMDIAAAFTHTVREMTSANETDLAISTWIAGALHDGLSKENWPIIKD